MLHTIEQQLVEFMKNSNASVVVNYSYGWVEIDAEGMEDSFFMQGFDAWEFIREVESLWERGDMTRQEAELLSAYSYI